MKLLASILIKAYLIFAPLRTNIGRLWCKAFRPNELEEYDPMQEIQ